MNNLSRILSDRGLNIQRFFNLDSISNFELAKLITFISKKTLTGYFARNLINEIGIGRMNARRLLDSSNELLFPEIYNNSKINEDDFETLISIRLAELLSTFDLLENGEDAYVESKFLPQHFAFGYAFPGEGGYLVCNNKDVTYLDEYLVFVETTKDSLMNLITGKTKIKNVGVLKEIQEDQELEYKLIQWTN